MHEDELRGFACQLVRSLSDERTLRARFTFPRDRIWNPSLFPPAGLDVRHEVNHVFPCVDAKPPRPNRCSEVCVKERFRLETREHRRENIYFLSDLQSVKNTR